MKQLVSVLVLFIVLLLIIVVVYLLLFFRPSVTPPPSVGVTVVPNHASPSPTPTISASPLSYTGRIIRIGPMDKESQTTVATMQTSNAQIPLYISPTTTITSRDNQTLTPHDIRVGMVVTANGNPSQGGIAVTTLAVH